MEPKNDGGNGEQGSSLMVQAPGIAKVVSQERLLCGPGPCNVPESVLKAMSIPLMGHMDAQFIKICDEVKALLQYVWQTKNDLTIPISGTGSAAMETCVANLVEEGDKVLVLTNGYFGGRFSEMCRRHKAEVVQIFRDWGEVFTDEEVEAAILKEKPAILMVVHAETSTGACHPLAGIGRMCKEHNIIFVVDTVTSISGVEFRLDEWGVDACYAGTQKCLNAPPGLGPVSFSEKARTKMNNRKTKTSNWYLDLDLIQGYLIPKKGKRRAYHHTAPVSMVLGLHEALRLIQEEGLENRWKRHRETAEYFWKKLEAIGMPPYVDHKIRLPSLTTVAIPKGVDGGAVCKYMMKEFRIEIAGGLGMLGGKVWRIGLMGMNSSKKVVDTLIPKLQAAVQQCGPAQSPNPMPSPEKNEEEESKKV